MAAFKQQLHRGCGGTLVLVSDGRVLKVHCADCANQWEIVLPFMPPNMPVLIPKDWEDYEP